MNKPNDAQIWKSLEKLRLAVGLNDSEWRRVLRCTPQKYRRYQRGTAPLSLVTVINVANAFELAFTAIVNGDFSPNRCAKRFRPKS